MFKQREKRQQRSDRKSRSPHGKAVRRRDPKRESQAENQSQRDQRALP